MLNDKIGGQGRQGRSGPAATEPRGTAEAAAVVVVEEGVLDVGVPAAGWERSFGNLNFPPFIWHVYLRHHSALTRCHTEPTERGADSSRDIQPRTTSASSRLQGQFMV